MRFSTETRRSLRTLTRETACRSAPEPRTSRPQFRQVLPTAERLKPPLAFSLPIAAVEARCMTLPITSEPKAKIEATDWRRVVLPWCGAQGSHTGRRTEGAWLLADRQVKGSRAPCASCPLCAGWSATSGLRSAGVADGARTGPFGARRILLEPRSRRVSGDASEGRRSQLGELVRELLSAGIEAREAVLAACPEPSRPSCRALRES
jgi:hypothetical protein